MTTIRIGRLVALTLLALSAFWGLTNGPHEAAAQATALQKAVGVGQIAYGVTALLAIVALWFRPAWAVRVATIWAVLITLTALAAALAWQADLRSTALAVFIFGGVGRIVVWMIGRTLSTGDQEPKP